MRSRRSLACLVLCAAACREGLVLPAPPVGPQPARLAPEQAFAGTQVRIEGAALGLSLATTWVAFGASAPRHPDDLAPDGSWLEVRVPEDARVGPGPAKVTVETPLGTGSTPQPLAFLGADRLRFEQISAVQSVGVVLRGVAPRSGEQSAMVLGEVLRLLDGGVRRVTSPHLQLLLGGDPIAADWGAHRRDTYFAVAAADGGSRWVLVSPDDEGCPEGSLRLDLVAGATDWRAEACLEQAGGCDEAAVAVHPDAGTALVVCREPGGAWLVSLESPPRVLWETHTSVPRPTFGAVLDAASFVVSLDVDHATRRVPAQLLRVEAATGAVHPEVVDVRTLGLPGAWAMGAARGRIALQGSFGRIRLLDAAAWPPVPERDLLWDGRQPRDLVFTHDGRSLAAVDEARHAVFFDLAAGAAGPAGRLESTLDALAPDTRGSYLAGSGRELLRVSAGLGQVLLRRALEVSPRGVRYGPRHQRALSAEDSAQETLAWSVRLRSAHLGALARIDADAAGGGAAWELVGPGLDEFVELPDGSAAIVRLGGAVRRLEDGRLSEPLDVGGEPRALQVSPDGEVLLVLARDGGGSRVRRLDLRPGSFGAARGEAQLDAFLPEGVIHFSAGLDGLAALATNDGLRVFSWKETGTGPACFALDRGEDEIVWWKVYRAPAGLLLVAEDAHAYAIALPDAAVRDLGPFPAEFAADSAVLSPGGTRLYWMEGGALASRPLDPRTFEPGAALRSILMPTVLPRQYEIAVAPDGESLVVLERDSDTLTTVR